jgi:hypothetical protein
MRIMPKPLRQFPSRFGIIITKQLLNPHKLAGRRAPEAMHPSPLDTEFVTGISNDASQAIFPSARFVLIQIHKSIRLIQLEKRMLLQNPHPSRLAALTQQLHLAFIQKHFV